MAVGVIYFIVIFMANTVGATGRVLNDGTRLRATPVTGTVLGLLDQGINCV